MAAQHSIHFSSKENLKFVLVIWWLFQLSPRQDWVCTPLNSYISRCSTTSATSVLLLIDLLRAKMIQMLLVPCLAVSFSHEAHPIHPLTAGSNSFSVKPSQYLWAYSFPQTDPHRTTHFLSDCPKLITLPKHHNHNVIETLVPVAYWIHYRKSSC